MQDAYLKAAVAGLLEDRLAFGEPGEEPHAAARSVTEMIASGRMASFVVRARCQDGDNRCDLLVTLAAASLL